MCAGLDLYGDDCKLRQRSLLLVWPSLEVRKTEGWGGEGAQQAMEDE